MVAINKQDLINYLKKSPENLNFNIFGTMLDDFRNTYETDEQIVDKIKNIITNIIEDGGSISPEDDTITELVDLITELLPEKMIIKPEGTLEITENGEYDVMNKAGVNVQIPLPSGTISITQNGTVNVNDYEYADVNVVDPLGEFVKNNVTNFEIPEGVTTIGRETFKNYTNLEEITIPDSVKTIEGQAFSNCSNLVTINNGTRVNSISSDAFSNCPSSLDAAYDREGHCYYAAYNHKLTVMGYGSTTAPYGPDVSSFFKKSIYTLILGTSSPSGMEFSDYSFSDYINVQNLIIKDNLRWSYNITGNLVSKKSLSSIVVDKNNPLLDSRDNCNAIIQTNKNRLVFGCKNTQIPNSVIKIGESAFESCNGLTSITIPSNVIEIERRAFCYSDLVNITIPNTVATIGSEAFCSNYSLENAIFENGCTNISGNMFESCIRLNNVTIPNTITSIGDNAFHDCTKLTDVYYTGTQEEWNNIQINSGNTPLTNATIHYNYTPSN